ncbi:MAG: hypothetical protein ACOY3Y_03650 [Acidobacteriota bacterium]
MRVLKHNVVFGHRLVPAGTPEEKLPGFGLTEDDLKAAKAHLVEVPRPRVEPAEEVETAPPGEAAEPMVAPPGRNERKGR